MYFSFKPLILFRIINPLPPGRCVVILGKTRPKNEFPTQEAIDLLLKGVKSYNLESEKRFHNWIKKYKELEGRMTPEEYKKNHPMPNIHLTRKQQGEDYEQ